MFQKCGKSTGLKVAIQSAATRNLRYYTIASKYDFQNCLPRFN